MLLTDIARPQQERLHRQAEHRSSWSSAGAGACTWALWRSTPVITIRAKAAFTRDVGLAALDGDALTIRSVRTAVGQPGSCE